MTFYNMILFLLTRYKIMTSEIFRRKLPYVICGNAIPGILLSHLVYKKLYFCWYVCLILSYGILLVDEFWVI